VATLLVHAEGNGWPGHPRPRPDAELVQWLAVRPATGERFGLLVAPAHALSPTTRENLELSSEELQRAVSGEELARRWRAFVRPDDVWCAWGHVPATLLAAAGIAPAETVDLRTWAQRSLG